MSHVLAFIAAFIETHFVFKKVGGLYHWRIGRLGGSFYWKKAARKVRRVKVVDIPLTTYEPVDLRGMPSAERLAFAMSTIR